MPREINEAGYALIKEFEAGPKLNSQPALEAYLCPAGKWTIGWGHTMGVTQGARITTAEAQKLLDKDLDWAEACVEQSAKVKPSANEFAAMVSLTLNIGAAGFKGSSVLRLHNAGDKTAAASAFSLWRKHTDPRTGALIDSPGLIRRRSIEANLYLTPDRGKPTETPIMPQAVEAETPLVSSKTVIAGGVTVAAGAGSVADQVSNVTPILDNVWTLGMTVSGIMKLGAVALSIIALGAGGYMLWRYIQKKRRGEVVST